MRLPTIDDWRLWRGTYRLLPAVAAWPHSRLPARWQSWWQAAPFSGLLETGKAGRYSVLAPRISRLLRCGETSTELVEVGDGCTTVAERLAGNPLEVLREWIRAHRAPPVPGIPPFPGGLLGYFSYDLARLLEELPARAADDLKIPLALVGVVDEVFVYDHAEGILFGAVHCRVEESADDRDLEETFAASLARLARMKEEWDARMPSMDERLADMRTPREPAPPAPARFSFSREQFMAAVEKIQNYIRSGDTYQTNLSVRETRPLQAPPEEVYEHLRRINPSPYMALLRFPGLCLVSGSPELLVRLRDGKLEARPIAGTRPRGANPREDEILNQELIENGKERAEHLMLVDLIRNDLGRVSAFGSVRVTEFMAIESYSHVMHIVSHIEGRLREDQDLFAAIAATFPGGTITGAPKVRTMEIIEELEPVRRGPYTGSIGWISYAGEMELNIAIRTLLALNGEAHVQAGAGIVIDSDPDREYQESIQKARALWAAVEAAEAELLVLSEEP